MEAAASPALRASLEERLHAVRGPGELPGPLLDLRVERLSLGTGAAAYVVRPANWPELREAESDAGNEPPYWAVPWPSGLVLARAIAAAPPPPGARVLELGCGLAVPSIAAARAGARVLATDGSADAAVFAAHNLALNEVEADVLPADWRDAADRLAAESWDLVLAADVLYRRANVESLLHLLTRLLTGETEAWIADPGRAGTEELLPTANKLWEVEYAHDDSDERVTLYRLRSRR